MVTPSSDMNIMSKIVPKQNTLVSEKVSSPQEVLEETTSRKDKPASPEEKLKQAAVVNNKLASPQAVPQGGKKQLLRHQFKKTELCRYHFGGKCKNGKACSFAHGASELNVAPDLAKTVMCQLWMAGKCNKSAEDCKFAHGSQDLRTTPLFEVSLLGKRMQKNSASRITPCINEVDMPPIRQNSKTNASHMSDIGSESNTCSDSNASNSPLASDADQRKNWFEAMTPPQSPSAEAIWVMSPEQQWIRALEVFFASAPIGQPDALARMLQNAAPDQYYD